MHQQSAPCNRTCVAQHIEACRHPSAPESTIWGQPLKPQPLNLALSVVQVHAAACRAPGHRGPDAPPHHEQAHPSRSRPYQATAWGWHPASSTTEPQYPPTRKSTPGRPHPDPFRIHNPVRGSVGHGQEVKNGWHGEAARANDQSHLEGCITSATLRAPQGPEQSDAGCMQAWAHSPDGSNGCRRIRRSPERSRRSGLKRSTTQSSSDTACQAVHVVCGTGRLLGPWSASLDLHVPNTRGQGSVSSHHCCLHCCACCYTCKAGEH